MKEFKQSAKAGRLLVGTMISELMSPNIPILVKACGFDYFILDCEHGCYDNSAVATLAATAKAAGIPMIVRIPLVSREHITRYLDAGVAGFLVPMISYASQLEQVIEYAKYLPIGKRGVSTTRAHTAYNLKDLGEYMKEANENTIIMAQIETVEGVKNVNEIAAVKGLDGLMIGPNDLTCDMGVPSGFDDPRLAAAIEATAAAIRANGLFGGTITTNMKLLKTCADSGMRVLSWSSELGMIVKSAKAGIKEIKAL